ncbi:MAG: enoyl-CoA hydratase-related protein [Myxococcota bacterium]|jgi:enoyl-CoA hydratase/carnithine racemase|nr:enoyl-CoA hydratase-related protein [Myxococcota bacterium]
MASYEMITYGVHGDVALITLNRPDKLNAWTPQMSEEMADALGRSNDDRNIGAIVLTGAGRGFCAGADMEDTFKSRIDGVDPGKDTQGGSGGLPAGLDWVKLVRESKPVVAAVNGAAVGIGLTMILPCDVILASERAKLGMGFIKMGLVPELASTHFLVQRMGFGRASEMCLSGRLYMAAEAHAQGLVDRLAPENEVLDQAMELAREFAANPAPQLLMTKRLLTENGSDTNLSEIQERESALLRECWKTPEHKEAVNAFIEKRPPKFR